MQRPEEEERTLRQKNEAGDIESETPVMLTAVAQDEGVLEAVEQMKKSEAERDDERAAIYVATVRPAMTTTRYRSIRLEGLSRHLSEGQNVTSTVMMTTGDPANDANGGVDGKSPDTSAVNGCGEGERPGEDARHGDGDGKFEAGEGAAAIEPDGEERALKRRRVTAERRLRRRTARKLARQRRQDKNTIQNGTKLRNEEKLDRRTTARRKEAENALQALTERLRQRETSPGEADGREREKPVQVKLVKQLRVRAESTAEVNQDGESFVGSADGLPTARVRVERTWRDVKLDSCARYTVAGTKWMQFGDRLDVKAPVESVEGIGGFLLDIVGVWRFRLKTVFGETICVDACIVNGCDDEFLLGVDFLMKHEAKLDFERNELTYRDKERRVIIPFRTGEATDSVGASVKVAAVRMARRTQLTGNAVTLVDVSVTAPDGELGMFVPTRCAGMVMLASTVARAQNGKAIVPMINAAPGRTKLPSKKELGVWIPIDSDMEVLEINGELERDRVKTWLDGISTQEPLEREDEVNIGVEDEDSRELVLKLLRAYRNLVETTGDCPPATALPVEHHIDTGDAAPIMLKRRRQAQTDDAIVDENVKKMLAAGVIEEGNGAWGFPVVLVRKKDGEVRFCVDYRALNKITRKDVYPLPRIDETLEALGGALLFSTLDLKAGYWQILMALRDRVKTAFMTKQGLYQFLRMPFGLMNAPSTFQRMMNGVLRGLTWTTCLVYLDDIVIYTKGGIERHVIELACVLERLSQAGLTLKLKKCKFATEQMEYLGHELSKEGVRPLDRLVTAVREFPKPTDAVEVKRFVHLAGYYRKFVPGFGSLMEPLTKLLRKKVKWKWGASQEEAFLAVKKILTTKPVLRYPDFRLPFRVCTDASTIGLGASLMQDGGDGWQPVAYASKVNSEAEAKYGITELECLAVVWAIKLFRPYLYGRRFVIVTDHAALKWLMTSGNLTGKLHRWALTLQEYDFVVEYRPGSTNVVADALSRAPVVSRTLAAIGRRKRGRRRVRTAGTLTHDATVAGDDQISMRSPDQSGNVISEQLAANNQPATKELTVTHGKSGLERAMEERTTSVRPSSSTEKRVIMPTCINGRRRLSRSEALRRTPAETTEVRGLYENRETSIDATLTQEKRKRRPVTSRSSTTAVKNRTTVDSDSMSLNESGAKTTTRQQATSIGPIRGPQTPVITNQAELQKRRFAEHERARVERRRVREQGDTLQLTDEEIGEAQRESKMVQRLIREGECRGKRVTTNYGLAVIETADGIKVILPASLRAIAFKECHDSIWAGHLRTTHTQARVSQVYWWPDLTKDVRRWVRGCQECGSRKAKPKEVVPPLRSLRGGNVGDRWALDVAGPLPVGEHGQRYVIAALEYVTRYAVATTVESHEASKVADFLMKEIVLKFGPFRELLTDGAPELTGKVIEELVKLLQAQQTNPVPYRPQMIGLVERFHRTWKDCVATYMSDERQCDWDSWVNFAVYAYNSGKHSTVALTPNELMMGRKLRTPNELLRRTHVTEAGDLTEYHENLLKSLKESHECAEEARRREQERQAKYYNRKARSKCEFKPGDRVWVFRPPRGAKASKFVHSWIGPTKIIEPAGYDNFLIRREDLDGRGELIIAHVSFLVKYQHPGQLLQRIGDDLIEELEDEGTLEQTPSTTTIGEAVETTTAPVSTITTGRVPKRTERAASSEDRPQEQRGMLVELRRRRRRNAAGQYVLEVELRPRRTADERQEESRTGREDGTFWVSMRDYEQFYQAARVVEDSGEGEGV